MNADDEKKLDEIVSQTSGSLNCATLAYALGRSAGMTEAAGICRAIGRTVSSYAAKQIEKARDAK